MAVASQSGAAGAERVAERNCPAVRVDVCRIIREPELPQHGECLGCEGFIELNDIQLVQRPALLGQELPNRIDRAHAHDARRDARDGATENPRPRGQVVTFDRQLHLR